MVLAASALVGLSLTAGWFAHAAIDGTKSWGTIPYRGHLEVDGVVGDEPIDLTFSLWSAKTGGAKLWEEVQVGIPVNSGSFSVQLGSVVSLNSAIEQAQDLFLAISVKAPTDTAFQPLSGRQALGASPFALAAKRGIPGQTFEADQLAVSGDTTVAGSVTGTNLRATGLDIAGVAQFAGSLVLADGSEVAGGELVGDASGAATWRRPPSDTLLPMSGSTQYMNATGRRLLATVIIGATCGVNRAAQIWVAPDNNGTPGTWAAVAFESSGGGCDAFTINAIVPRGYFYRYEPINGAGAINAWAMEI